jgi:hypothetical protein
MENDKRPGQFKEGHEQPGGIVLSVAKWFAFCLLQDACRGARFTCPVRKPMLYSPPCTKQSYPRGYLWRCRS